MGALTCTFSRHKALAMANATLLNLPRRSTWFVPLGMLFNTVAAARLLPSTIFIFNCGNLRIWSSQCAFSWCFCTHQRLFKSKPLFYIEFHNAIYKSYYDLSYSLDRIFQWRKSIETYFPIAFFCAKINWIPSFEWLFFELNNLSSLNK